MRSVYRILRVLLWLALLTPVFPAAAYMPASSPESMGANAAPLPPEKPKARRGITLFHRPARKTPVAQIEWARTLEAGNHTIRASRAFLALVYAWPDSPEAPEAQLALARLMEKRNKLSTAFAEYQYLIDRYVGQYPHLEVLERQYQIGLKRKDREMLETVVKNGPAAPIAPEALYQSGLIAEKARDYDLAILDFQSLQNRYPGSVRVEESAYREARNLYTLCMDLSPQDEIRFLSARTAVARFLRLYPNSLQAPEARQLQKTIESRLAAFAFQKAFFYDRQLRPPRPASALVAYRDFVRRFPDAERVPVARNRIAELEQLTGTNTHEKIAP
jgi:TolA-binding protein